MRRVSQGLEYVVARVPSILDLLTMCLEAYLPLAFESSSRESAVNALIFAI